MPFIGAEAFDAPRDEPGSAHEEGLLKAKEAEEKARLDAEAHARAAAEERRQTEAERFRNEQEQATRAEKELLDKKQREQKRRGKKLRTRAYDFGKKR
jgi:type IV secretory pathway VirB9-like protein